MNETVRRVQLYTERPWSLPLLELELTPQVESRE